MANECACVICTLSRLNGGCLHGHACMYGVGPVCVRCTGRPLVGRPHNLQHRVLKQMKGRAPIFIHKKDLFPLDG